MIGSCIWSIEAQQTSKQNFIQFIIIIIIIIIIVIIIYLCFSAPLSSL